MATRHVVHSRVTGERPQDREREFNVVDKVLEVRHLVAKAEALAVLAEGLLNNMRWADDDGTLRLLERLSYLVCATSDAVEDAMAAGDRLIADLASHPSES